MNAIDEFWEKPGVPRAEQRALWDYVGVPGSERREEIRRAIGARVLEQEVTFNILGTPDGSQRPWELDEMPWLLPATDFDELARGLAQRARVLSLLLDDVYGPQKLLRERVLPEALVFGNPHYFRACHGLLRRGGEHLILYAADVARGPDGKFRVYSDRTAAPTGAGYALENRLAIGQVLAQPFQNYRVRKINSFFETIHRGLLGLAKKRETAPRVVLLTPGLQDESSFEHAYLARYLGIELVEGRDLTVRGDELFSKTLEGLKRVDVVLRRVVDDFCDPLELRGDSALGIAGLVSAARAGSVGIANPLGSGLVESAAFKAYLPALAKSLLGEELALPSVDTRWCGDPRQLDEVNQTLSSWIFKPAFNERRSDVLDARLLEKPELERFRKQLGESPARYVAERWLDPSTVPLGSGLDVSAPVNLRLFACRSGADYVVMPGGLARVRDTPDGLFLTVQKDAVSKDVWVPSLEKGGEAPQLPRMPVQKLELRRGGIDLPSRLFDDIFWLGRYVERCENTARLARAGLEPIASEGRDIDPRVEKAILSTLFSLEILTPTSGKSPGMDRLLLAAIYDADKPNSVAATLHRVHHLTTAARSRLSRDAWAVLRRLTSTLSRERPVQVDQALDDARELILVLAAFHGIVGSNMVRGHAWMFLEMGRRIERGVFVLTLLQELFPGDGSRVLMETLLSICDSLLTYRSRYLSTLQAAPVADLVLTDETNPQAVLFQVRRLLECVRALPREVPFPVSRAEQRLITLEARLVTADLEKACANGAEALRELAEEGANLMWQVSDDLTQTYFTHAGASRAVAPTLWIDENLEAR